MVSLQLDLELLKFPFLLPAVTLSSCFHHLMSCSDLRNALFEISIIFTLDTHYTSVHNCMYPYRPSRPLHGHRIRDVGKFQYTNEAHYGYIHVLKRSPYALIFGSSLYLWRSCLINSVGYSRSNNLDKIIIRMCGGSGVGQIKNNVFYRKRVYIRSEFSNTRQNWLNVRTSISRMVIFLIKISHLDVDYISLIACRVVFSLKGD